MARGMPKNAFFLGFGIGGHDLPHPRRSLYAPPVHPCTLQRTRTDCTRQAAAQAVPNARQTMHTGIHAQTLDTLHRSALDARQAAPGTAAGLEGLQSLYHVYCGSAPFGMVYW